MSTRNSDPYLDLLERWQETVKLLASFKEQEAEQRRMLFSGAFPNPKEGVQRHQLPDGNCIKGEYKITRSLELSSLPHCLHALQEAGVANVDGLVRYKPELAVSEWRCLSDESKLMFAPAVIATPGMPSLTIEAPKEKKGKM